MKRLLAIIILLLITTIGLSAQEVRFGKNKVRYKDFEWHYIQSRHFDVHFYEGAYPTAKFAVAVLESSYTEITGELNYLIQRRIPVFVYNSHNDFQQTNIIPSLISEGVGGFTEAFKNRIVIPFTGSYEDFRHVLHHELTHAVIYDLLYGNNLSSLIARRRLFSLPLWYAEGYAEYSSRHGWDYWSDMVVRDASINGYMAPPWALGGYLAYKQGQAMVKYIAEHYGEDKLGEILRKGKVHLTMNKALKEAIGIELEELWEKFSKEMKRRYWPEIAKRKDVDEVAKQLTKARKDGSYFNEEPVYTPDGDAIAYFTDRSDYTEIILVSAKDGTKIKSLVESQRSGDLESLHSYVSGMSFSPDGRFLTFVAKSGGKESLILFDLEKGKISEKKKLDYYNVRSPAWSPDGKMIAFSALKNHKRDLFIYHLESDEIEQLTDDRYDDTDPSWLPNSESIIFASDRSHPDNPELKLGEHLYVNPGAFMPGDFTYGYYNLFKIKRDGLMLEPLKVGPGQNKLPEVSPDGEKVAFISNRNGIDNLYISFLDGSSTFAVTDIISGIKTHSWSPTGEKIAFSAFNKGAFDIFVIKDLVPVGDNGVLAVTDYMKGKYDLLRTEQSSKTLAAHRGSDLDSTQSDSTLTDMTDQTSDSVQAISDSTTLLANNTQIDTATSLQPVDSTIAEDSVNVIATIVDTTLVAQSDSTDTEDDSGDDKNTEDTKTTIQTGIIDGEYVFVSDESVDPLDSMMIDLGSDSTESIRIGQTEPAFFDSVPVPTEDGEYEIKDYEVRFTPDFMGGGFAYDTFFGVRGQSYFAFSDYLGNHQIYIATDLVNTIDQSFIQAYYFYNRKRTNFGVGMFHSKNFYLDATRKLFSDRFYGVQLFATRPFSTFSRIEGSLSHIFVDRQYHDFDDTRADRNSKVLTTEFAYVTDNIVWGMTGPVNGRRSRLTLSNGISLFDRGDIDYTAFELDYRKYWHFKKTFSMAFRMSGGASFGKTPKQYFLGGTTNWIGNRTLDAQVYEVENLYFSDIITPLRGIPYYELSGDRYGLINWEFRFPMIQYFVMRFPLQIAITNVTGAIFTDFGAAWHGDNFKFGTTANGTRLQDVKSGFGFGMRANLGFILLRYDLAWTTDFYNVSDKPTYYFSFGADF